MSNYSVIEGLEPQRVLRYFCDISEIPRAPGKQEKISQFIVDFAEKLGLEYHQDEYLNVIVRKPASLGYENSPSVMLQAHLDMVCEKDSDVEHDFDKDSIRIQKKGDHIYARGTTLGADNGVGVAYMMAILADKFLKHPPLEAVFTTDEETDMGGAFNLDYDKIKSRRIINLDEGAIKVCHPGTLMIEMTFPKNTVKRQDKKLCYRIEVSGLMGGHTGQNAMAERGNAVVLLNRLLVGIDKKIANELISIHGGFGTPSAFARDAHALILIDDGNRVELENIVKEFKRVYKKELKIKDPKVQITMEQIDSDLNPLDKKTADTLKKLILILPDGVFSLNKHYPDRFESSSNIGVVRTQEDQIYLSMLIRSTNAGKKYYLYDKVVALCSILGVSHNIGRDLPHWEESHDEQMMNIIKKVYPDTKPDMSNCTLECGIFAQNLPQASIVVLGPPYYNAHSPNEYFSISETQYYWNKLLKVLENLK